MSVLISIDTLQSLAFSQLIVRVILGGRATNIAIRNSKCSCCHRLCSKLPLALLTVDLICIFIIVYVGIGQPIDQMMSYLEADNYITLPCNMINFTVQLRYDCSLNCLSCVSTVGISGYQSCQQFTTPPTSAVYNSSQLVEAEDFPANLTGQQFYPCSNSCYHICTPVTVVGYSYEMDF